MRAFSSDDAEIIHIYLCCSLDLQSTFPLNISHKYSIPSKQDDRHLLELISFAAEADSWLHGMFAVNHRKSASFLTSL